jgi:hypothetical protein
MHSFYVLKMKKKHATIAMTLENKLTATKEPRKCRRQMSGAVPPTGV